MRATVMYGAGDVRVDEAPDAGLEAATDALLRVTRACICGSDLCPNRKLDPSRRAWRRGRRWRWWATAPPPDEPETG